MSEQSGQAAGTAKPEVPPTPWHVDTDIPAIIYASNDEWVGTVLAPGIGAADAEYFETSRRIVACVNFCAPFMTDVLESLAGGEFTVTIARKNPEERQRQVNEELAEARASFTRDLRNGNAVLNGQLAGGAL